MHDMFAPLVYLLCFATSSICAYLLGRNYLRTRAPLLLWSGLCFLLLAVNNLLLVIDLLVLPEVDLRIERLVLALIGVGTLLFGCIWNVEKDA